MSTRTNQSVSNAVVSCLEALEMGYDFVKTCSRCDYYAQNKALNMKALTLPWKELSKLWQCTSKHNVGELFHAKCGGTPHQAAISSSSTNYI
jgi:hypothetical protein